MKVLYPIQAFYPHHGGGPSLTVYWIAKALVAKGVEVKVVTSNKGLENKFKENTWEDVDGIKVRYCSGNSFIRYIKIIWHSVANLRWCDVVNLESFCFPPSFVICLFSSLLTRKKIIWSPRGELSKTFLEESGSKKKLFKLYGSLFRNRVVFHGTSDAEIEDILCTIGDCIVIKLPNYLELPTKVETERCNILVYLGRINPVKSIHKLIEALHNSSGFMNSDYVLKIAGKAVTPESVAYAQKLRQLIEELDMSNKVMMIGEVNGRQKDELLASAKYSFLVSESENFGNVVVEAMAQGTPVITSLGTPWQVLADCNIGYHVSNDIKSLSHTIDDALSLPNEVYNDFRKRVYVFCREEFDITTNIDKWIHAFEGDKE